MAEPRRHSASSIETADQCRYKWALRYIDGIRPPELTWADVLAYDAEVERLRMWRGADVPGHVTPAGGQRGAALGSATHTYAEWWLTGAASDDSESPFWIDWASLPGQVLQSMLPHLPARGSIAPGNVEHEFSFAASNGEIFRGLIDVLDLPPAPAVKGRPTWPGGGGGVWDHKTSRDIRAYAKLPHALALAIAEPKRSLRDDLQACIYALRYSRAVDSREDVTCRWTYGETDKSRRSLQVIQAIPVAHAQAVVDAAAERAATLTYEGSDDAPANTLACDDYGGCWYRRAGHCTKSRDYGRLALIIEQKETQMAAKKLTWTDLQNGVGAANSPAPAAPDVEEAEAVEPEPTPAPAPIARKRMPKPAPAPAPVVTVAAVEMLNTDVTLADAITLVQSLLDSRVTVTITGTR